MMGCGRILKEGQWWGFCGETDMGQTLPALCKECGGEYKIAKPERFINDSKENNMKKKLRTDEIIEEYEKFYWKIHGRNPKIVRRGSWVYIGDSPTAHRVSNLSAMTERLMERENKRNKIKNISALVPINADTEYTIRKIVSDIRQDGRNIFRSTNLKEIQKAGNRVAKMAKRILNLLDEHDEDVVSALSKY